VDPPGDRTAGCGDPGGDHTEAAAAAVEGDLGDGSGVAMSYTDLLPGYYCSQGDHGWDWEVHVLAEGRSLAGSYFCDILVG
jgi:hypothetical protein